MKIDGHGFNQQWAWGKTEAQFVEEFKNMPDIFPDAPDKVAKLKEAYGILQQKKPEGFKPPKGPEVIASTDLVKENVHLLETASPKEPVSTSVAGTQKTAGPKDNAGSPA